MPTSRLLSGAGRLLSGAGVLLGLLAALSAEGRPNIVFIMSDDHAYQAIGAYGSTMNATPNIDRLAREGVRFDRCYVTDSICAPSRAVLLTGKYGHLNGVTDNYTEFDGSQPTMPKRMRAAGYQTALIGKWHLKSDPTGFDHWDILPGQGRYYGPQFRTADGVREVPGYVTEVTTDLAVDWLTKGRDPEKPFLLLLHHKAPHRPWRPAVATMDHYRDTVFPEPETLADDYAGRTSAPREAEMRIEQMRPDVDLKIWGPGNTHRAWLYRNMTDEERAAWEKNYGPRLAEWGDAGGTDLERRKWMYQLYLKDYLRCIDSVDQGVGRVLDCLDAEGLADDTIVLYTSDQGFYLGEHGWFDKRFMYEQSLRTPLLVRWPGHAAPGTVEERIVSNVDFAPTFLDAAGAEVPAGMQGASLVPILAGEAAPDWRDDFYYNYREGPERDHAVERHEGVTDGRYKLIHFYDKQEWELYDLQTDPNEVENRYGDPALEAVQRRLTERLDALRAELDVPAETTLTADDS